MPFILPDMFGVMSLAAYRKLYGCVGFCQRDEGRNSYFNGSWELLKLGWW